MIAARLGALISEGDRRSGPPMARPAGRLRSIACLPVVFALLVAACARDGATPGARPSAPRVIMETSAGVMVIELDGRAPLTMENFLRYVDAGAYDGATFYRSTRADNDPMISVVQGGLWKPFEPDGDAGFEPPFPTIGHETTAMTGIAHGHGVVSMARAEPGTASSEFFISVGENPSLDFGGARNPDGQGFAAFGRVVEGFDVLQSIHSRPTRTGAGFAGQILVEPIAIARMRRSQE